MKCPICNSAMSEPVQELFALPSVTSDCRPWGCGRSVQICSGCGVMRRVTKKGALFERVYDDYKSYPEPEGRTKKILDFVKDKMPLPKSILDVGCGEGHGISVMQSFYPDAVVQGYEPYRDKARPRGKFDLITLFHVLEHVEDLHEMLGYIKSVLKPEGHILIQVPYTAMWPFDLVLADHWWHFGVNSLLRLLSSASFCVKYCGNNPVNKEITLLVNMKPNDWPYCEYDVRETNPIDWILNYKKFLDAVDEPVAVFGTGPAAAWAGNILGDKAKIYLDNDMSRRGWFRGKPVFPPDTCHSPVVAPFPDWQLPAIKAKHPNLRFL